MFYYNIKWYLKKAKRLDVCTKLIKCFFFINYKQKI